jgi:hypothetical protein
LLDIDHNKTVDFRELLFIEAAIGERHVGGCCYNGAELACLFGGI